MLVSRMSFLARRQKKEFLVLPPKKIPGEKMNHLDPSSEIPSKARGGPALGENTRELSY